MSDRFLFVLVQSLEGFPPARSVVGSQETLLSDGANEWTHAPTVVLAPHPLSFTVLS